MAALTQLSHKPLGGVSTSRLDAGIVFESEELLAPLGPVRPPRTVRVVPHLALTSVVSVG